MILRPYQEAAIDTIMAAIPTDETILMQLATGAGKTIIFCDLIKRLITKWPNIRIGILAHRRELITQAKDKLIKVWPEAPIGIACASISNEIETEMPVMIGSVQTLIRRTGTTSPFDIVIIDEAHRVPEMNIKSQYSSWINTMRQYNPKTRILGFTATPFRLSHGYIFGNMCKKGNVNLFNDLHFRIGIKDLQKDGYLCQYRAKVLADISSDLSCVRKQGDYNISDLSEVMSKQHHVGSAVQAFHDYAQDRKHVIVFAVTIAHAEKLCEAFGGQATIIHSKLSDSERITALNDFESGKTRIIVNVGILTEGFDSPAVDCIIMCRPTVSSALFVQMCGRGLRPHPDKTDVLILDLANNCLVHGDPDSPKVVIPKPDKKKEEQIIEKKQKVCPACKEAIDPRCTICPVCGYEFVQENNDKVQLTDYDFREPPKPILEVEVGEAVFHKHVSRAGNIMVKLNLECYHENGEIPIHLNHYFQFDFDAHPYARGNSRKVWRKITGDDPPETTDEALERAHEFYSGLAAVDTIKIQEDGKFMKVIKWN